MVANKEQTAGGADLRHHYPNIDEKRAEAWDWFRALRDQVCLAFEQIEADNGSDARFIAEDWEYKQGQGGGKMSSLKGKIFEKACVQISHIDGRFSEAVAHRIPGAADDPSFKASGISVIAHMHSPLVPAVHMNTRLIITQQAWFGGGSDLTPTYPDEAETALFHKYLQQACDQFDPKYYPDFKKRCDEYFFLPHRNEPRGVGGIFYDYINTESWAKDLGFTKAVGSNFLTAYNEIVRRKCNLQWTSEQKEQQLYKRGRYAEFNLLYDRGTQFGLQTGGNVKAILGSMPPEVKWE